jgi:uncharacterized lipoprotein YddW (UPF0748 family)
VFFLKRILSTIILLLLAIPAAAQPATTATLAPLPLAGPVSAEVLGSGVWWRPTFDEEIIEQVMADLGRWGHSNCLVESFWNGQTIYPSKLFPPKTRDGKDWLAIICAAGARHGVRVHAWIHTLYWQHGRERLTSATLLGANPDWVEIAKDGNIPAGGEKDYVFASPSVPAVREKLGKLVDELCERDIAGVNLDYIRYQTSELDFGYNPVAVRLFREKTGIDPLTIQKDNGPGSPWMKWVEFREGQVTRVVEELSSRIRLHGARKEKRILVSAAFFPGYAKERGSNPKFQDWMSWVKAGYLDFSTPMCYSPELHGLDAELEEVREAHSGTAVACLPGLAVGTFSSPHPLFAEQMPAVHKAGFRHVMVFKFETLKHEMNGR